MPGFRRLLLRASSAALLTGLLGLPRPLLAEEAEAELAPITVEARPTTSYTETTASTATRGEAKAIDVPQSVTTVTGAALADRGATSVIEALATISGVTQANTVAGRQDAVIRRGFGSAGDGSILTDGLKTVLPHAFNPTVERVDVLKGPASTLYGVLDPGGMVNLVSKTPQLTFGGRAYTRVDALGAGRMSQTAGLDVTGPIAGTNLSYRVIAEVQDGDYWRNYGKTRNTTFAPSLSWDDGVTRLTASLLYQEYSLPYDRGTVYDAASGHFLDISRRERLDEPFAKNEGHSAMVRLQWERALAGDWKASAGYAYSRDSFTADQVRVLSYNSSTGIATRRTDTRDYYDTDAHALRAELAGSAMLLGLRNELLFGATWNREHTDRAALRRCNSGDAFDVNDPVYGSIGECANASAKVDNEHETITTASVYAQDRLHLSDSLIAVGGLRLEHYDLRAGVEDTINSDSSGTALLPNAGLVWKLAPALSLYGNVAKSFRPNSSINSAYGDLDPEEGISYELGMKFDMGERLSGTLAAYTSDKKNVAYSETVAGETVYRTAGLVRAKGVELDLTGQLTDRLQLIGSFAYTDAKVKDDPDYAGKRLANVAPRTAALYLAYDQGEVFDGRGSLRYGGGLRGVSARAGDSDNSFDLPGYAVVDLFAAYTFEREKPVTLQLNLNNVLDKTYYASSIGNSAYSVEVGEPFSASLSLSVAF